MVELKFVGKPEEIRAEVMQFFQWNVVGASHAQQPMPLDEAPKPKKVEQVEKPSPKTEQTPPAAEPKAEKPAAQATTTDIPAVPKIDPLFAQMQTSLATLMKAKGRDAVLNLFKQHGVTRGSEIKPEDYQRVITTIAALVA